VAYVDLCRPKFEWKVRLIYIWEAFGSVWDKVPSGMTMESIIGMQEHAVNTESLCWDSLQLGYYRRRIIITHTVI
jgi:hypothetical protein